MLFPEPERFPLTAMPVSQPEGMVSAKLYEVMEASVSLFNHSSILRRKRCLEFSVDGTI
jgi:hypothetical protein